MTKNATRALNYGLAGGTQTISAAGIKFDFEKVCEKVIMDVTAAVDGRTGGLVDCIVSLKRQAETK